MKALSALLFFLAAIFPEFDAIRDSITAYCSTLAFNDDTIRVQRVWVSGSGKKSKKKTLNIRFSRELGFYPYRDGDIEHIYDIVRENMPDKYAAYRNNFIIRVKKTDLRQFRPRYFTSRDSEPPGGGIVTLSSGRTPFVAPLKRVVNPTRGLSGANIAIWQSHGYYFEQQLDRWEWQRARLFGIVEDTFTQNFLHPFLIPMLENAGAYVLTPRERDPQTDEIIVDNDIPGSGYSESGKWENTPGKGFAFTPGTPLSGGDNPFEMGTARKRSIQRNASKASLVASWIPARFASGREYAVYVSYKTLPNSVNDARYLVRHAGGETWIRVNQRMCGGTWVYIGTFKFSKGENHTQGVFLSNYSRCDKSLLTADAVRFGGGMGSVSRGKGANACTSGKPRYNEAARYWLQWAGFPDSVYTVSKFENDYKDDVKSRGEWVNYLTGKMKLPVDFSFALHTDAGVRNSDSIVGTLAIYHDMNHRDYADIIQTQVVSDIRATFRTDWTRRCLWDMKYAEVLGPKVPALLLELLSHQNFFDMRLGLDPAFRFTVSRAIYKGMLRYFSWVNDRDYIVAPLPVKDFSVELQRGEKLTARLRWTPVEDPLEPTAVADRYVVYTRVDDGGFDDGRLFEGTEARIEIAPGHLYSFRVSAANAGGLSLPSETLCAATAPKEVSRGICALAVNDFYRVSPPASFISPDSLRAGFLYGEDGGVPYLYDVSHTGAQYEFDRSQPWRDDDDPGFGASFADNDGAYTTGNTFDFVSVHSRAMLFAGFDVASTSVGALREGRINLDHYPLADFICGKETEPFDAPLRQIVGNYVSGGGRLLVSGSYVFASLASSAEPSAQTWGERTFGVKLRGRNAVAAPLRGEGFYTVERTEALEPSCSAAFTVRRYPVSNMSAAVACRGSRSKSDSSEVGTVCVGYPLECSPTSVGDIAELLRLFFE